MDQILDEFKHLDRLNLLGIKREMKEDENRPSDDQFGQALHDIYISNHDEQDYGYDEISTIDQFTMEELEKLLRICLIISLQIKLVSLRKW